MAACTRRNDAAARPDRQLRYNRVENDVRRQSGLEGTYSSGELVDPRGGMKVTSDGAVYVAGAIQTVKSNSADIAALIL